MESAQDRRDFSEFKWELEPTSPPRERKEFSRQVRMQPSRFLVSLTALWAFALSFVFSVSGANADEPALSFAPLSLLREGNAPRSASVSLAAPASSSVLVSLSSSDPAQATVPATVTIEAGQLAAYFTVTPVDDALQDGSQSVTLTASAAGFAGANVVATVADNDVHHFEISAIAQSQIRNLPRPLTVTARDVNGAAITNFTGPVALLGTSGGGPVPCGPATIDRFSGGAWSGEVAFAAYADNVTLTASAGSASGTSNVFSVVRGPFARFGWSPIGPAVLQDSLLNVTLRAEDAGGNLVEEFSDSAALAGLSELGPRPPTNAGISTASAILPGSRTGRLQTIYTPGEVGGEGTLSALEFQLSSLPVSSSSATYTIRLKHTDLTRTDVWESDGWTTVHKSVVPRFSSLGWVKFEFSTPFAYDGNRNLMVDFIVETEEFGFGFGGSYYADYPLRGIYYDTLSGDPFAWNSLSPTLPASSPILRFSSFAQMSRIRPATTGPFSGGVWSGTVSIPLITPRGVLNALHASGVRGASDVIAVRPPLPDASARLYAEDFEQSGPLVSVAPYPAASTTIPSGWVFSGQTYWETAVSATGTPHGGQKHLVLDSTSPSIASRSEATWTVDLAGRRGVLLKFWAKGFSETPGSAPQIPFMSGADFDGVAVSTDGYNWYEVQPLRPLSNSWVQYTVDLDAAIAVRGIAYNANFKIRFNRYGSDKIPYRGIAVDDIEILSTSRVMELAVSLPAQIREDGVPLTGTVTLPAAVQRDTMITLQSLASAKVSVPAAITIPAGHLKGYFKIDPINDSLVDGDKTVGIVASSPLFSPGSATMAVVDDEFSRPSFRILKTDAVEGDAALHATISVDQVSDVPLTFNVVSSDPTEIYVLPTITLAAGASSVDLVLNVVNDSIIDGPQSATVTVSRGVTFSQSATITVADNETMNLKLVPSAGASLVSVPENAGVVQFTATMSGTLPTDTTLTLASSDPSKIVPSAPTIVIPAGYSGVSAISFQVLNDDDPAGTGPVTLSVSANGFTSGSYQLTFLNNDPHHFTISPIASPQVRGAPIPITVSARDAAGNVVPGFNGTVTLSAPVPIEPATLAGFVDGEWSGTVRATGFANGVILNATDGSGHAGTSNAFDVGTGSLHTFAWSPIPGVNPPGAPIPVGLKAVDIGGNVLTQANDVVNLAAFVPVMAATVGAGDSTTFAFLWPFVRARAQVLYLASEIGGPQTLAGLSLTVDAGTAGDTLSNFTIRMKTTSRDRFEFNDGWDSDGWTVVHRSNQTTIASGSMTFLFDVPYHYDGTENLLVDFSYNNAGFVPATITWRADFGTTSGMLRSFGTTASDPLTWSEKVGSPSVSNYRPQTRFLKLEPIAGILPTTGQLDAGSWQSSISFQGLVDRVFLEASGLVGGSARSAGFAIAAPIAAAATLPFTDGFESGSLSNAWRSSATGNGWTRVVSTNSPKSGSRHAILDSEVGPGRAELTLTADLAGYSGVTLNFWAKRFSNSDDGPPPSPFVGGADFDGVAISADGINWHEVQPLRGMSTNVWTSFSINLDAAIAARGLAYTAAFRIRFNQFATYAYSPDGVAIDDVSLTGTAGPRLSLALPASVSEGGGAVNGTISLPSPAASEVTITLAASSPQSLAVPASVIIPSGQSSAVFPITPANNSAVAGAFDVSITATAPGFPAAAGKVQIIDDEVLSMALSIPTPLKETSGSVTGTLTISSAPAGAFPVNLQSSHPSVVQLPASITIQPGQTTMAFPARVLPDSKITGPQYVTITATAPGVPAASVAMVVGDDESRLLSMSNATVVEGSLNNASLSPSWILGTDLVVSLSSSDPLIATVPASVTIPSGASAVNVPITAVDNAVIDGAKTVFITASAQGFSPATSKVTVKDNETQRFEFANIPELWIRGKALPIKIAAVNVDGLSASFTGPLSLTATGDAGPVTITPATVNMGAGMWTGDVTITTISKSVRITATNGAGITVSSVAFDVSHGPPARYTWSAIAPSQNAGQAIQATLTALDAANNVATGYSGYVAVGIAPIERTITAGTPISNSTFPFGSSHDQRTQVIYPASELGGSGTLTSLALYCSAAPPPQTQWTIRIKHTALATYSTANWESAGWTTVYSGNVSPQLGWVTYNFSTPFVYDGTSNLMVDLSFNNTVAGIAGTVRAYAPGGNRSLYFSSNSLHGDPLAWSGTSPAGQLSSTVPQIKLGVAVPTAVSPSLVFISSGTWTGQIWVPAWNGNLALTVTDLNDGRGASSSFTVAAPPDSDADKLPNFWESAHGLALGSGGGDDGPQGDPDRDGISNLLEWAFDLNPRTAALAGLPTCAIRINPADGQRYLELTYRRRLGSVGLQYQVETADGAMTWNSNPAQTEVVSVLPSTEFASTEDVTIRVLPAIGAPGVPTKSARVRVLAP